MCCTLLLQNTLYELSLTDAHGLLRQTGGEEAPPAAAEGTGQ